MCSPSKPAQATVVTPPPAAAPQPLASADIADSALNLSQLRIGSKNNLKLRAVAPKAAVTPPSLSIPTAPAAGSAA